MAETTKCIQCNRHRTSPPDNYITKSIKEETKPSSRVKRIIDQRERLKEVFKCIFCDNPDWTMITYYEEGDGFPEGDPWETESPNQITVMEQRTPASKHKRRNSEKDK